MSFLHEMLDALRHSRPSKQCAPPAERSGDRIDAEADAAFAAPAAENELALGTDQQGRQVCDLERDPRGRVEVSPAGRVLGQSIVSMVVLIERGVKIDEVIRAAGCRPPSGDWP